MFKTMKPMTKGNKSRPRKSYDAEKSLAVKATAEKFRVSESYVRMCLAGTKNYGQCDKIKKFYTEKYSELQAILS